MAESFARRGPRFVADMSARTKLLWSALLVLTAGGLVTVIVLTALQEQPAGTGLWLLFAWALALLVIWLVLRRWDDPAARPAGSDDT